MISASLIKELESQGFELEFPSFGSNEEKIIAILKEKSQRLNTALPILLQDPFDYKLICKKIPKDLDKEFVRILEITKLLFKKYKIPYKHIHALLHKTQKITKQEFSYYESAFIESIKRKRRATEEAQQQQMKFRSQLNMNKALAAIFSPAKRRILDKIFNHRPLTNTELKYYYRAIRPLNHAILHQQMREYLKLIESIKKITH